MITIELQRPAYEGALEAEQMRIKNAIFHDLIIVAAKAGTLELEDIHAALKDISNGFEKEILDYKALQQTNRIN